MTQNHQDRLKKQQNWEEEIQKWQESGLNQTAYCRLYEIDIKRFVYWKKRLSKTVSSNSLVEVTLGQFHHQENPHLAPLRLLIGNHYRIEVERGFDRAALHQLICVLEGR